jgi:15-cis-phytoene synthase/lycopene beta-cyclase
VYPINVEIYPQPMHEDVMALYGFCRVSDDIVDAPHLVLQNQAGIDIDFNHSKVAFEALRKFVDACYQLDSILNSTSINSCMSHNITAAINALTEFQNLKHGLTPLTESAWRSMRPFARRVPRCVPQHVIYELLEGYEWDLNGKRMGTEAEMRGYYERVASSVGEACTYMMLYHGMSPLHRTCSPISTMQRASSLGFEIEEDKGGNGCRRRKMVGSFCRCCS